MAETRFGPLPADEVTHCAPTELDEETGTHLKGTAHDFSARLLGGTCGIAGTFSALADLTRFLRHTLTPTQATFGQSWIADSLRIRTGEPTPGRGLFWHPAPGTELREDIWVHYGFTGTGMWISPEQQRWAALLTDKLFFTRDCEPLTAVRGRFRELVFSIADQPSVAVPDRRSGTATEG